MTTEAKPRLKITYATLRNDNEELHAGSRRGLGQGADELGGHHQQPRRRRVARRRRYVREALADRRRRSWARSRKGTREDVQDAIAAAREAFPAWGRRPWQERVAILRRAADLISERQMEFAALMAIEVGKNRLEALGDVEETADLIRW